MRYEFNLHVENVFRVEMESDKPLHDVVAAVMDAYKEGRLTLDEGESIKAELWDGDGNQVAEFDAWGSDWRVEEGE